MSVPTPQTPYIAVDRALLQRNINRASALASKAGIVLRPHVKTHKCPEIARMQVDAGAVGITVATMGEAEVFASAGFTDILIAYPVWLSEHKAERLAALLNQATIRMGVDSFESGQRIAALLGERSKQISFLIEIDSGHHRSGIEPESVGELAHKLLECGLTVSGVFTFPGHSYTPHGGSEAAHDEATALTIAREQLISTGITGDMIVSGGSTPSFTHAETSVVTEQRPGVYVFNDAQQLELESCDWEDISLTVRTTVVSARGNRVIVDAGSKALGADKAPYASGFGRVMGHPDARIIALSEHHATIEFPQGTVLPVLGSEIDVVPNHVCNTVNLADELFVFDHSKLVDCWKIAARGRNN